MQSRLHQLASALFMLCAINASATVLYVDLNSTNATQPYTNWITAATNIQAAVDAAMDGDLVLVTNGVYQVGGRAVSGTMTNRVAVDKPLTVQSVNGPQLTLIQGRKFAGTYGPGAVRCVYLTNGASLSGFTLTNGATQSEFDTWDYMGGGGARCESSDAVISNCVIAGNTSFAGGAAAFGTLVNCLVTGNSAYTAGGAYGSTLKNCTLTGNLGIIPIVPLPLLASLLFPHHPKIHFPPIAH
jgi:hypothetical protein